MNLKECRKSPRIVADNIRTNITSPEADAKSVSQIDCRVVNISLDGVQIETQYPIKSEHVNL